MRNTGAVKTWLNCIANLNIQEKKGSYYFVCIINVGYATQILTEGV